MLREDAISIYLGRDLEVGRGHLNVSSSSVNKVHTEGESLKKRKRGAYGGSSSVDEIHTEGESLKHHRKRGVIEAPVL